LQTSLPPNLDLWKIKMKKKKEHPQRSTGLLKATTAAIANFKRECKTLIAKIPDLETQKKAAVAKRDYKAAGKASKETKDATLRLKDCEEELVGDAANCKTAAEEELTWLDGELYKAQKVAGQTKMAMLVKKIQTLVARKQELCGETASSEKSVRGVGALVLENQIKALKDQGQDLGSKYGGWNELLQGIQEEEGKYEETAPAEEATSEETPPIEEPALAEEAISEENLTGEEIEIVFAFIRRRSYQLSGRRTRNH
jgi:hypothetical protein